MGGRTLGAEEELHVIDPETWGLAASAPRLLRQLPAERFGIELQRSTVETNARPSASLSELHDELQGLRRELIAAAEASGLAVAAVGIVPVADSWHFELTGSGRFSRMRDDYQLLVDEQLICGVQIHVEVEDRDLAVRVAQRLGPVLPTLLALSASSPFWRGTDSGYASMRTIIWQRWPTAGPFGPLESAQEYDAMIEALIDTGVITDPKMAYFDVRPGTMHPTVELRICDACPLVDDAVLIAGLFRAAANRAIREDAVGVPLPVWGGPHQRAALWRAARSGLADDLLQGTPARPRPASEVVRSLIEEIRPDLEEAGDWDDVVGLAEATLARGTSADRQRLVLSELGDLAAVTRSLVAETAGGPGASAGPVRSVHAYPATRRDEAVMLSGSPTFHYRTLLGLLDDLGPTEVAARQHRLSERAAEIGMTFAFESEHRPFPLDAVPRVVAPHEWAQVSAGLIQRARAIEAFLHDIYGPARIVADGVIDQALLSRLPGFRPEGHAIPAGGVRAAIIGFDLIRDPLSGWRVLEDNTRVPSGLGYAAGLRQVMQDVLPELAAGISLLDPDEAVRELLPTLQRCSDAADPVVALLSDGEGSPAWFEHQLLAERAGLMLVRPHELSIGSDGITASDRKVDVMYLRLDHELVDLNDRSGRPIGRALFEAAASGLVSLANAPGNGIADDKALYRYMPDVITYYLAEKPKLRSVPTYLCAEPDECATVLDRIGELVTKPVDGYGGRGVLIGPDATDDELRARQSEILTDPQRWVAQETIALSTVPTLVADHLEPRHVDLRAFVFVRGPAAGDVSVATAALTRVAPRGSRIVNSSRGGGAKDTWILAETAEKRA
jgi:carboxylate-amine ligase